MTGERAERFVVFNLRLLAASFAVTGILFIAAPDGVLDVISDVGEWFGDFPRAPETTEQLWLALGFVYMVASPDLPGRPGRRGALPAAAARARRRQGGVVARGLGFFVFDQDVFIYLLNFIVDGFLVGVALLLWSLSGRVAPVAAPT